MSLSATPTATYYNVKGPQLPLDEADATLADPDPNLPCDEALAGFEIPKALARYYPELGEFDFSNVTHFVLKVYYIEQAKILARAGVRYNWDFPFIFWHFLGRIVSEAFLDYEDQLLLISASVDGDREYVSFATRFYVDNDAALPKTIEVSLGWDDGHDPLVDRIQAFWTPARPNIVANIQLTTERQTAAARFAEVTQAVLHQSPTGEVGKEGEDVGEDIFDDDASGEAIVDLQGPVETPRTRVLVVSEGRMYYDVYFSPFEYRFIPLEQRLPVRAEPDVRIIP